MHFKRLIIAAIVLPLTYFYITKLSAIYFLFFQIVVASMAQYEFYSMFKVRGLSRLIGIVLGILALSVAYFSKGILGEFFMISLMIIASARLFSVRSPELSLRDISFLLTGVIYIPGLIGYQIYLREYDAEWIIFLYGCVWASDSLAYYIGKGIGKRKLYEEMSPNKTIAGAVGSIMGGAIGAIIMQYVFMRSLSLSLGNIIILGTIIGVVTIIGDLVESMVKRDAGIKDSSNILPGHGGMFDKVDSVLFAGPVLYWTAAALKLIK